MKKQTLFKKSHLFALFFVLASLNVYAGEINFSGQLDVILVDNGGVFSGTPIGTDFFGVFDDVTGNGTISNGTTVASVSSYYPTGGVDVENNYRLNADHAALLNTLVGSSMFRAGDRIDVINIEGERLTPGGGWIEIGLSYVFDASTFSDASLNNYPFDPEDVLLSLFFIVEEDAYDEEVYYGAGQLDGTSSSLWEPSGWLYMQWPYCYSFSDQTVFYFDEQGAQYCWDQCTARQVQFGYECMGTGWVYVLWPQAYWFSDRCLYSFNETDQLNVQDQSTGEWFIMGAE